MDPHRPRTGLALAALLACAGPALADGGTQTISTDSLAYGSFDAVSDSLGPWPASNFGVRASVSLATDVAAGVQGATQFTFPTIAAGDVFHASTSQITYGFVPNWTNATVASHSALSASASFDYDLGPFSGSKSIYDQALNATSNGDLHPGTGLSAGSANSTAAGDQYGPTYGLSAFVASASVGLKVGLELRNDISYTPTVSYGYYSWANATGGLTSADTLTWTAASGTSLGYVFPKDIATSVGSPNFHLNFMPAVRMDLTIDGSSTVTVPLAGNLTAQAFGATLIDVNLALGNVYDDKRTFSTWHDDVEWNNGLYYSLKLHQDNLDCQFHQVPSCATYTVEAEPTFVSQTLLPEDTTHDYFGTSTGGFDPGLSNAPKLPQICDPRSGECWSSDDQNAPLGPGNETYSVSSVPDPASWITMIAGLTMLVPAGRRRRRRLDGPREDESPRGAHQGRHQP